jgi:hypothetical protein
VKGIPVQRVQVPPEELSVRLGSYPDGGEGDRAVEASGTEVRFWRAASMRAATRVKPEQASKGRMRAPSHPFLGEGRRGGVEQPTEEIPSARRGNGRGTYVSIGMQHGRPAAELKYWHPAVRGWGRGRSRRGPYYLGSRVMPVEGRGPGSGCVLEESRSRGLA